MHIMQRGIMRKHRLPISATISLRHEIRLLNKQNEFLDESNVFESKQIERNLQIIEENLRILENTAKKPVSVRLKAIPCKPKTY